MRWLLFLLALAGAAPAAAQSSADRFAAGILAIHNRERALVGAPALAWDPRLAAEAASYAPALVAMDRLEHSADETRGDTGENLAMGTLGYYSPEALTQLWVDEKRDFPGGVYPEPDEDDWSDIGHYTQMVWSGTTHVGCAVAASRDDLYLICRYSPAGNVIGEYVIAAERERDRQAEFLPVALSALLPTER